MHNSSPVICSALYITTDKNNVRCHYTLHMLLNGKAGGAGERSEDLSDCMLALASWCVGRYVGHWVVNEGGNYCGTNYDARAFYGHPYLLH